MGQYCLREWDLCFRGPELGIGAKYGIFGSPMMQAIDGDIEEQAYNGS
jgi:hypothetical protein